MKYTVEIERNPEPANPRNTSLCAIWCWGSDVGDPNGRDELIKAVVKSKYFDKIPITDSFSWDDDRCLLMAAHQCKDITIIPLYLNDFKRTVLTTSPYSQNQKQVGIAFITKEFASLISDNSNEVINFIRKELDVYNKYLNGEVYCYKIFDEEGKIVDFILNLYNKDQAIEYALDELKYMFEQEN